MLATYAKAVTRPRAAARAREGALWVRTAYGL
jgi:hypothetical protein